MGPSMSWAAGLPVPEGREKGLAPETLLMFSRGQGLPESSQLCAAPPQPQQEEVPARLGEKPRNHERQVW